MASGEIEYKQSELLTKKADSSANNKRSATIIATWSAGYNRQPSAAFADAERDIVARLREWLIKR